MDLEDVALDDRSSITARYQLGGAPGGGDVLVVACAGAYRDGSAGAPDARRMVAHVEAGLALWRPDAVVLDLAALAYRWGDGLVGVFEAAATGGDALLPRPVAIVTGAGSRGGLASLCLPDALFAERAAAVAAVRAEALARDVERARVERALVVAIVVRDDLTPGAAIELVARAPTLYLEFVPHDWRTLTWRIEGGAAVVRRATPAQLAAVASHAPVHVIADPSDRARPLAVVLGARVEIPQVVRDLPSW